MTPPVARPSRRAVLGLLGAVPLVAGGAVAAAAAPVPAGPSGGLASRRGRVGSGGVPAGLRPDGTYDRYVRQRAGEDQFSGTVLLAHRGRPVLVRSHGMADRDRGLPNGPDTIFSLASVTKVFTALAVVQLVQRGEVALHATLGTYLDGFPAEAASTVTVAHLLTHTSGIGLPPRGPAIPGSTEWDSFEEVMDGTLAAIRSAPSRFAAGTRYAYSNDEFFVLGAIVARVSGQSYFDYVRRHVFDPAGMTSTDFYSRPQVRAATDIARPYWQQQPAGPRVDFTTTPFFPFTTGPAGGAYSTAPDLLRFARALSAGVLLGPAHVDLATGGKVALPPSAPGRTTCYAFGFEDEIVAGHRVFGHSGAGPGTATQIDVYPDLDWVSVVLGNYDTTIAPIVDLGRDLVTA